MSWSPFDPHPDTEHYVGADARAMAQALADGRTTSEQLVRRHLDRIAAVDDGGPQLNSILALSATAIDEARALDAERAAGRTRGPLHGLPVLIKDNVEAVGLPGTAGSLALAGRVVERDAPLVSALRAAGLVILGSTNLSEWANLRSPRSTSGWSAVGGLTGNPWALDRSAGGSSSGSGAAVAAGLAPFAIGTDTDGSIVCPASLNGCVGIKPTVGLVPTEGVVPLSASQDSPGPMARTVADVAALLDALTASTRHSDAVASAAPAPLAATTTWLTGHAATDAAYADALARLDAAGLAVARVEQPDCPPEVEDAELVVLLAETKDGLDRHLAARPGEGVHSLADVVAFNTEHADLELAHFGQEYFVQADATAGLAEPGYPEARAACLAWAVDAALGPVLRGEGAPVALLAPAYPPAWKSDLVGGDHFYGGSAAITAAAMAGWPLVCLPMGLVGGMPVGMLLVGRPHEEASLLAAAARVEEALGLRGGWRPAWSVPARG